MALTVTTAPFGGVDGFAFIGNGPLEYVFTESSVVGKTNYRVEIEFDGLTLPVFSYRPEPGTTNVTITADVATPLRSLLRMTASESDRLFDTHIKYQAVWNTGSDAQVDLTANQLYCFIGAQNFLVDRVGDIISPSGGVFLLPDADLETWVGRSAFFDFLHGGLGVNSIVTVESELNNLEVIINSFDGTTPGLESNSFLQGDYNIGHVSQFVNLEEETASESSTYKIYFGSSDVDQGIGQSIYGSAFNGPAFAALKLRKIGSPTQSVTFELYVNSLGGTPTGAILAQVTVQLKALPDAEVHTILLDFSSFSYDFLGAFTYSIVLKPNNDGVGDANNYYSLNGNGSAGILPPMVRKTAGVWATITDRTYFMYAVTRTDNEEINIITFPECENPVFLRWLNDYGGLVTYLFDQDQVFEFFPDEDGRFVNKTVFANTLTEADWIAFNELNKTGAEFGDNEKLGAFVQDYTDEDNPLNIYVLPRSTSIRTRNSRHRFEITLRYPILENIGI